MSLSSGHHGIIQDIFEQISLTKNPELWESADLNRSRERISLLSSMSDFKSILDGRTRNKNGNLGKNSKLSGLFREKGNALYKNGDFKASLSVYNQALLLAPADEDIYSISLANRSAVWYEIKNYDNAIQDIDRALENSYPSQLRFKLLERKAKCFLAMGRIGKAGETIREFEEIMKISDLKTNVKNKKIEVLKKDFEKLRESSSGTEVSVNGKSQDIKEVEKLVLGYTPNTVEVRSTPKHGRFIVATKDIRPGESFCTERPFVKHLDKEYVKSHCWNCLNRTWIPLPCHKCSGVIFCSDKCADEADATYHRYECGLTDIIHQANVGTWNLSYRAFTSKPFEFWHNFSRKTSKDPIFNSFWDMAVTHKEGYFNAPGLMKEALASVFFVRCLQSTGYLNKNAEKFGPKSDEMNSALLLIHLMRISSFNTHELTEISSTNNVIRRIGTAVNPNLALINHSCDPNYGRVWNPLTGALTGFATRFIEAGTEIYDSYSGIFCNQDINRRSEIHEKYHFKCDCPACVHNWPLLNNLPIEWPSKSAGKKLRPLYEDIEAVSSVDNCVKFLDEGRKVLEHPHALLIAVEDRLHRCLIKKYSGNGGY